MVSTFRVSALADLFIPTPDAIGQGIVLHQSHPLTMINLRGPADAEFCDTVASICSCNLPIAPNSSSASPAGEILKLGPNEWLLVARPDSLWSENLAIPRGTLTDVSHGRVAVRVDGDKSCDLLAKGCAVDLHPKKFPPGTCIQTSIDKISLILHKQKNNSFMLYAARSYAGSFWHWLTTAANEYGYHVVTSQNHANKHHR